jgi:hypothetical protein
MTPAQGIGAMPRAGEQKVLIRGKPALRGVGEDGD